MLAAIHTIWIADLVTSLDNVLAVAAAAKVNLSLLVRGLQVSTPWIFFRSNSAHQCDGAFPRHHHGKSCPSGLLSGRNAPD